MEVAVRRRRRPLAARIDELRVCEAGGREAVGLDEAGVLTRRVWLPGPARIRCRGSRCERGSREQRAAHERNEYPSHPFSPSACARSTEGPTQGPTGQFLSCDYVSAGSTWKSSTRFLTFLSETAPMARKKMPAAPP